MITKIFSLLTRNNPGVRRFIWKTWYNLLGGRFQQKDWVFMNYGYEPLDETETRPDLEGFREQDRSCIQLYDHLARSIPLDGKTVVEVGSGRGGGCTWVQSKHGAKKTRGIDFSDEAVKLCRKRHHMDGLSFRQGDAEDLPLGDGRVDVVLNVESSHCYGSREKFLGEVYRVLRPGGHFLYTDFFDEEEINSVPDILKELGFTVKTERNISPNVVAAMDKDHDWKQERIRAELPSFIASTFEQFAGLKDSKIYNQFNDGELTYMSWVLQK